MNIDELIAEFGTNTAPTQADIETAQRDAIVYGEAAEMLVSKVGIRKGHTAAEQPVFGPLVRMLALAGWTIAGSGYFSAVFWKGGLAIKISLRATSDAAMDYLAWCRDHQDMPGIPQVHAMKQSANTYTVLMDRYEAATHLLNPRDDNFDEILDAEFKEIQEAINTGAAPQYFNTAATALAIHSEFDTVARFDMHRGNVMLDRDGGIIITDPLGRSFEATEQVTTDYSYSYSYHTGTSYRHAA